MKFFMKTVEQVSHSLAFVVACEDKSEVNKIIESHYKDTSFLSGQVWIYSISEKDAKVNKVDGVKCNFAVALGEHLIDRNNIK